MKLHEIIPKLLEEKQRSGSIISDSFGLKTVPHITYYLRGDGNDIRFTVKNTKISGDANIGVTEIMSDDWEFQ